jgi:hypothetical protein
MIDPLLAGCALLLFAVGTAAIRLADRLLPPRRCGLCYGAMPGGWARFSRRWLCEECSAMLHKAGADGQYPLAMRAASNARIAGLTDQAVRDAIARAINWDHTFRRDWDHVIGLHPPGDPPDADSSF